MLTVFRVNACFQTPDQALISADIDWADDVAACPPDA